jgi:hypothetical protein
MMKGWKDFWQAGKNGLDDRQAGRTGRMTSRLAGQAGFLAGWQDSQDDRQARKMTGWQDYWQVGGTDRMKSRLAR